MAGKWRQMSDSPGDWGFDDFITDPTAAGWYWKKTYIETPRRSPPCYRRGVNRFALAS
jgi:hypothetical protein